MGPTNVTPAPPAVLRGVTGEPSVDSAAGADAGLRLSVLVADGADGLGAILGDRIGNQDLDVRLAADAHAALAAFVVGHYDVVLLPGILEGSTPGRLVGDLRALPGGQLALIMVYTYVTAAPLQVACLEAGADRVISLPATTEHLRITITSAVRRARQLITAARDRTG